MVPSPGKFLSVKGIKTVASAFDISVDGHVHTRLCHHASGEMEDYVLSAIQRGLSKIIFLEHYESGISYFQSTWLNEDDFAYYHEEGRRLRQKYRGGIEIGLGIEVGFNPDRIERTRDFIQQYQWDRIALSYHYLKTPHGHVNMVSRRQDSIDRMVAIGIDRVVSAYFAGLLQGIKELPAEVVCHVDAVLRHYPGLSFNEQHHAQLDEVLERIKEKNIALEVNTSGFVHRNEPYPSFSLLQKAKKMGIRLVAGSDAHRPEDVGRYFDRLAVLL